MERLETRETASACPSQRSSTRSQGIAVHTAGVGGAIRNEPYRTKPCSGLYRVAPIVNFRV